MKQTDTLASAPDTPNILTKDTERVVRISARVGRSVGRTEKHAIYSISTNIKSFLRWCIGLTFRPPGGTNSRGSACTKQLVKFLRKAERSICSDSLHWIATACEHSRRVQVRKVNSLANGMAFSKIRQLLTSWRNSFNAAVFWKVKPYITNVSEDHAASIFRVEMDAAGSSEMLLPMYQTVRRHTSKYSSLQSHLPKTVNVTRNPLPLRNPHSSSHPATRTYSKTAEPCPHHSIPFLQDRF